MRGQQHVRFLEINRLLACSKTRVWSHSTEARFACAIIRYDTFTAGIIGVNASFVGGKVVHISPWRWTNPSTPPMSKAYFGLVQGRCASAVCDVFVSYDRDANGGEGPDCPMCKVHRLHGSYDKVFVMRVSLSAQATALTLDA